MTHCAAPSSHPPGRRHLVARSAGCGIAIALLALGPACTTTSVSSGVARPMPAEPRDPPPVPAGARVNSMAFIVGSKPIDSDGNGWPDRIEATVTLFASPHRTPLWEPGRLVCSMFLKGHARTDQTPPITEWTFEGETLDRAKFTSQVGRQYALFLNLLDLGSDRLPFGDVDLICRFEPADGRPAVQCQGVRSIQIGRRAAN